MPNYRFINRYKTYQENRKIMRPNFKNINIITDAFAQNGRGSIPCNPEDKWITPELIPVKPIYTQADLEGMEHLNYVAGIPPFLRGPYSGMYAMPVFPLQKNRTHFIAVISQPDRKDSP